MGLIILEGPNGVGKTHTALEMVRNFDGPVQYIHNVRSDANTIIEQTARAAATPDTLHVWDRSWLSEAVYYNFYGRSTPDIDLDMMVERVHPVIESIGHIVILHRRWADIDQTGRGRYNKLLPNTEPQEIHTAVTRRYSIWAERLSIPVLTTPLREAFQNVYIESAMHKGGQYTAAATSKPVSMNGTH